MSEPAWHTPAYPELRSGPPWVMREMMDRQPGLATALLEADGGAIAGAVRDAVESGQRVVVCGCGTSEHAAHGVAALLDAALPGVRARPALSAALDPHPGLCLAVSHDGGTRATRLALDAARSAGARTAAITAKPGASIAQAADHVLVTPESDRSWCHTVGYTSPLLAAGAVAARLGLDGVDGAAASRLLRDALAGSQADPLAAALADRRVVLCAGAGVDHVTARELALKVAEGARMPTTALELETVLHGQLAGHEPDDALILVAIADHPERDRLARRAEHVARAAAAIGLPVAALLSPGYAERLDPELTPAGRLTVPAPAGLHPTLAALLAGAAALQALTLALAHARGTNPDLIRREEQPYRAAAEAAEEPAGW